MTPEQIAELEALAEKSTPGPWLRSNDPKKWVSSLAPVTSQEWRDNVENDAALIIALRNNLPRILAALKAQQPDAQAEPVAWMYEAYGVKQAYAYQLPDWSPSKGTETPLYAHLPKAKQPGEDMVERVAIRDITGERERQITDEHWSPEHDDKHSGGEMAMAAACYAYGEIIDTQTGYCLWPWFEDWWKPADTRRNLVKAGALIVAEIERLDRAAIAAMQESRDGHD